MNSAIPEEPLGSESERTSAAWVRTALAVLAFAIVMLRAGVVTSSPADVAAAVAAFGCAAGLARLGRREYRTRTRAPRFLLQAVSATAAALGLLALVAVLMQ